MTTPEQLQAWREDFEADLPEHKTRKFESGTYNLNHIADMWAVYQCRCQETEHIMKMAKFGAEVANHMDGIGSMTSVTFWHVAARVGVLTEDESEYAPNIGETIERLLK